MLFDCWNRRRINGTCQTLELKRFRFLARQESRGKKKEEMTQESRWPAAVSSWSLTEVLGRKTQEEWMTRAHEWTCKEGKESVKRGVLLALHPVISFSDDVSHFLFVQFLGHTPSSFLRTVLSKSSFFVFSFYFLRICVFSSFVLNLQFQMYMYVYSRVERETSSLLSFLNILLCELFWTRVGHEQPVSTNDSALLVCRCDPQYNRDFNERHSICHPLCT